MRGREAGLGRRFCGDLGGSDVAIVFREIERKYDAAGAPAALAAVTSMTGAAGIAAVSQHDLETLDAVYYDTEDLRLIRAGVTLRRRTGGEDAGWHLKLPAGADTRDEIRLPLAAAGPAVEPTAGMAGKKAASTAPGAAARTAGKPAVTARGKAAGGVPAELASLVRARTRGAALAPVVRMRTSRSVLRLLDDAGRTLAEIAADHVSAEPADESAAVSWDEIEVELVTGDRDLLEAVDARLRAAGARPAATATKLERALGDRLRAARRPAGDQAGDAAGQGPPLTPRSPAGEVVLGYVRQQALAITRLDPLVRRDEPDAVHQMRVATRRARSVLQAFGEIVERERTRPLCDELKWLAAVLGQARDAEVLLARFTGELAAIPADLVAGPVGTRIAGHFAARLEHARAAVVRELDGQRYISLLDDLDALLADPPLTPLAAGKARTVLAKPVRRAARRLRRALAGVPAAGDKDAAIHEARKAAKRARYAAEAAMPALGRQASSQAATAKKLQGLLGDHHDSVVARTVLRGIAGDARAAAEDTFTYGVLHQRQACQASEIERMLPQVAAPLRK
jgi:CHAD domain-containing protein